MVATARARRGEARLPSALVVVVAIALYALLPEQLVIGPRLVIPGLEVALLVALVGVNPSRMTRDTPWSRIVALTLVCLIAVANAVALVLLLRQLVTTGSDEAVELLIAAGQVWLTNVIVYGIAYWELDRGGPVARTHLPRVQLPPADFRFPQDEDADAIVEVRIRSSRASDWVPTVVDYLYMSLTNSSAFSPTDTMPLSTRAKILMGIESTSALFISVLVIAKGVGSLGQ
ncbi:hypothetical protein [Winogradskya humida]|uniref:DUF1345 domain-containing protein n=1 Tax=Winogradskya humida TaxID=113566 RepID=A0ABQ4A4H5_9ACTN|nr:hypothetical protein [Actinoplanes humidus]GIE25750.1 hypothetical protein Ahu01nite_088520 [Actinoplanes humidus]